MYETIKRLYGQTKNPLIASAAVVKKWISEEDYFKITGFVYPATSVPPVEPEPPAEPSTEPETDPTVVE